MACIASSITNVVALKATKVQVSAAAPARAPVLLSSSPAITIFLEITNPESAPEILPGSVLYRRRPARCGAPRVRETRDVCFFGSPALRPPRAPVPTVLVTLHSCVEPKPRESCYEFSPVFRDFTTRTTC